MRGRSTEQVARYLAHHAIEIKEGSDHEFSLEAHNRSLGGGPATAAWFYSLTKGTCYGALVAGGTVAVIKTGGAALPAVKGVLAGAFLLVCGYPFLKY